jgi:hypothetical protein
MTARARKFAGQLPKTFPGCWESARFARKYHAAWMKQKRGSEAEYRARELRAQRGGKLPAARPALPIALSTRRRDVEDMRRAALENGKCFYCMERRAIERVERARRTAARQVVMLSIPYCGRC